MEAGAVTGERKTRTKMATDRRSERTSRCARRGRTPPSPASAFPSSPPAAAPRRLRLRLRRPSSRACVARRRRPPQLRPSTARRRAAAAASRTTHRLIIRKGNNWNEHSKKRKKTRTKIRQNPQSGQMPEKDLCRCKLETGNNQEPKSINQSCLWAAAWLQMKTWKFSQAK